MKNFVYILLGLLYIALLWELDGIRRAYRHSVGLTEENVVYEVAEKLKKKPDEGKVSSTESGSAATGASGKSSVESPKPAAELNGYFDHLFARVEQLDKQIKMCQKKSMGTGFKAFKPLSTWLEEVKNNKNDILAGLETKQEVLENFTSDDKGIQWWYGIGVSEKRKLIEYLEEPLPTPSDESGSLIDPDEEEDDSGDIL